MNVLIAMFLLLTIGPAQAGLSEAQLTSVADKPSPNARLDLSLAARDASGSMRSLREIVRGKRAFLIFVDYTCNTLCGTDLLFLGAAIERAHLDPSSFRLIVFGIDPRDKASDAHAMVGGEIPARILPATELLLPDKATVDRATSALGFHFLYDPAIDQFAHPAVVYVLDADGRLLQTLSPFELTTRNMHEVIFGKIPATSLYERFVLTCYAYDPVHGVYTLKIARVLEGAAGATALLLAGAVLYLSMRTKPA